MPNITTLATVSNITSSTTFVVINTGLTRRYSYQDLKNKLTNDGLGGGAGALSNLSDVTFTTPTSGQVLKYNGAKWVNGTGGEIYTLNTATGSVLGGVKIGTGISITGDGTISAAGGSTPSRSSASVTSASLNTGTSGNYEITGFKGYGLLSIQTSVAAWVTVYSSVAARTADSARIITADPNPGSGVIAEVINTSGTTQYFSPALIGYSSENVPSASIPIKIYNNGDNSAAITVTLKLIQLEA